MATRMSANGIVCERIFASRLRTRVGSLAKARITAEFLPTLESQATLRGTGLGVDGREVNVFHGVAAWGEIGWRFEDGVFHHFGRRLRGVPGADVFATLRSGSLGSGCRVRGSGLN